MTDNTPITLEEACRLYPGSSFKISTLRAEAQRKRLNIFRLGRRYHTTKADMDAWVSLCRDHNPRPDSTSIRSAASGSSVMVPRSCAQDVLKATLSRLKSSSRAI